MSQHDPSKPETPRAEPEILPPERGGAGARTRKPGDIFFDMRGGADGGPSVKLTKIGGFKLVMILIVALAIAIALVLTFASLFVIAAVVSAALAAIAVLVAWVRRVFREGLAIKCLGPAAQN